MAARFSDKYRAWIRPFRHWWKPLAWIWGALILGVVVNDGSSWLITKSLDVSGTPLGWGIDHPWITLPCLFALLLLTGLSAVAYWQATPLTLLTESHLTLSPQQRLQYVRSFQQEYTRRLNHSLQGRAAIALGLRERTDLLASSVQLVFQRTESGTKTSLPVGTSIVQVYDLAQRGFLLLGAPGSGKTTLLLELAQELLQRAESNLDQPLAIILNLSSWATKQQPLALWLSEQCFIAYGIPRLVSAAWLAHEQMLLLLDGLDEMEATARTTCIEAINTYREEHQAPLVVCSRSYEYEQQQARLIISEAVEIQSITQQQVSAYLRQAGKSTAAVRAALQSNTTLQQLITTPLLLSIVVLTYRDRAVKDLPQMGTSEEQQREIFTHYIDRMLERHRSSRMTFPSSRIIHPLTWLAQHMQQHHLTEFYLEQLQPTWLATTRAQHLNAVLFGLLVGLPFGLACGLFGGQFSLAFGLVFGLAFVLVFGLAFREKVITPIEVFAWSWKRFWPVLLFGLVSGVLFGVLFGVLGGPAMGLSLGLAVGLGFGLGFGLLEGLSGTPVNIDLRLELNQGIHQSGQNALRVGILIALAVVLVFGLAFGLVNELLLGLLLGLFFGPLVGWGVGLRFGGKAYLRHYVLRFLLWRSGVLPWHVVRLCEEATECILLAKVGGGYRFIHPLLQAHFASLPTTTPLPSSKMTPPTP